MPWREVSKIDERREFVRLAIRKERTGASCVDGSGFILTLGTSGLVGPRKSFPIALGGRIRARHGPRR